MKSNGIVPNIEKTNTNGIPESASGGVGYNVPPLKCALSWSTMTARINLSRPRNCAGSTTPADWKLANIVLFKKGKTGKKDDPKKYRPVSFISEPGKAMEIILEGIDKHPKGNANIDHQQGFLRGKSCLSNSISFNDKETHLADQGKPVNTIFLYSSKAFNTVSHRILLDKISSTELDKHIMKWVPRGSILSSVLFNIFRNDLDIGLKGILSKFTDDTKLGEAVGSLDVLQRDLDKIEDWANINHMKFNKGKWCWILHLGWGNPGWIDRLGNEMLESRLMENNLGILVSGKLNMSQQCPGSQEGQPCPGGIRHSMASQAREGIVLLC
ncbi:hypothetical protein HGM15179_006530 [Zosterops borbonicus]|uniref:Reverse transcriptase domain-containing protein n=1 Tax=Zosterops borbonicus TaxID=364589 RepID=A0A8K1GLV8_9PASS|nr:hypothetical protein HGM15179_006530 [Zosterops borbonicus]